MRVLRGGRRSLSVARKLGISFAIIGFLVLISSATGLIFIGPVAQTVSLNSNTRSPLVVQFGELTADIYCSIAALDTAIGEASEFEIAQLCLVCH